jgi:regulatory protein YycH of two-component signal transduction system YycFG
MPVVYAIIDTRTGEKIYIGSTKNKYHRFKSHKSYSMNPNAHNYSQHVYQFIRENGGWVGNYECVVLWQIPEHVSPQFVRMVEQIEINLNQGVKNKCKAYRGDLGEYSIEELIQ